MSATTERALSVVQDWGHEGEPGTRSVSMVLESEWRLILFEQASGSDGQVWLFFRSGPRFGSLVREAAKALIARREKLSGQGASHQERSP